MRDRDARSFRLVSVPLVRTQPPGRVKLHGGACHVDIRGRAQLIKEKYVCGDENTQQHVCIIRVDPAFREGVSVL